MEQPQLWTPQEVAKYLRVSTHSVYMWLRSGRLRGVRAGKWWRVETDELTNFLRREAKERS